MAVLWENTELLTSDSLMLHQHKSWNNYRASPTTNSADQNCGISLMLAVTKSFPAPWCAGKPKPRSHYWYNWSRAGLGDLWWDQVIPSATCLPSDRGGSVGAELKGMKELEKLAQDNCCSCYKHRTWTVTTQCRRGISPSQMPDPAWKLHCPLLKWKQHLPAQDCRASSR